MFWEREQKCQGTPEEKARNIYRVDGKYTGKELKQFAGYMHMDFQARKIQLPRFAEIIVEYPPLDISTTEDWNRVINEVFIPEISSLHPVLRKQRIIVRFPDHLNDEKKRISAGGTAHTQGDEEWIRVACRASDGEFINEINAAFILMHELAETDFWYKTKKNDKEAHQDNAKSIQFLKSDKFAYRYLLDEKVANRRAIRAVRRLWSNANFINPEYRYPEDELLGLEQF